MTRLTRRQPPPTNRGLLPEARLCVLPAGITHTSGPRIIAVARTLGLGLDRWQEDLARIIWARTADRALAIDSLGLSVPRQAGKTYAIGALVFAYCIVTPDVTAVWTAQHSTVMLETFQSLRALAQRDKVSRHISRIRGSAEQRSIEFRNGSRIVMKARENGALRGVANVAVAVFDEAQILSESALSDILPTQNVAKDALSLFMGTPPRPQDPGEVFTNRRNAALDALKTGRPLELEAWVEMAADPDCDTDDKQQLRRANPSYPKRTPLRAIRKLRRSLSEAHFRREVLGIWDDLSTPAVIPPDVWERCADQASRPVEKFVLAIDVSPNRQQAAVAFAGWRDDELVHVELAQSREGTGWIVDWVTERCARNPISAVVVDGKGPAASLARQLRAAKVKVVTTTAEDMTTACADLQDACMNGELRHIAQPQLTRALNEGRKRSIGDRWAWNRRTEQSDITPIVAATLAHWGVLSTKVKKTALRLGERRRGGAVW